MPITERERGRGTVIVWLDREMKGVNLNLSTIHSLTHAVASARSNMRAIALVARHTVNRVVDCAIEQEPSVSR